MKKPSGHVLIVANGEAPPAPFLRAAAKDAAVVLCTDGAYVAARRAGLKPDWIIGDLDSLPPKTAFAPGVRVIVDDDPEASDLEKAVRFAAESRFASRYGSGQAWIVGALGGRLDQLLSNLQVLERYAAVLRLRLADPSGTAEIVSGSGKFQAKKGETVSLFPLGDAVVSAAGLKYPLKNQLLQPGSRGLSNEARAPWVRLNVRGAVWLFRSRPPWA